VFVYYNKIIFINFFCLDRTIKKNCYKIISIFESYFLSSKYDFCYKRHKMVNICWAIGRLRRGKIVFLLVINFRSYYREYIVLKMRPRQRW